MSKVYEVERENFSIDQIGDNYYLSDVGLPIGRFPSIRCVIDDDVIRLPVVYYMDNICVSI